MTISQTSPTQHASWWQLLVIFIIALCIFSGLRWQPEAWLQSQINQQAKQHGITISYAQLQTHFFTIRAEQVSIQTTQLPAPLLLDSLTLTPDWSALLFGHIRIHAHAQWHAQDIHGLIIKQNDRIIVRDLLAKLDARNLQPMLKKSIPLPLQAYGTVLISGSIQLHSNGHPLLGHIKLLWNTAAIDLLGSHHALGDYKLVINSNQTSTPWQWNLNGGSALKLTGKGNIDTTTQSPHAWPINGTIRININRNKAPILARITGNKTREFSLSGSISHPQLQAL